MLGSKMRPKEATIARFFRWVKVLFIEIDCFLHFCEPYSEK